LREDRDKMATIYCAYLSWKICSVDINLGHFILPGADGSPRGIIIIVYVSHIICFVFIEKDHKILLDSIARFVSHDQHSIV